MFDENDAGLEGEAIEQRGPRSLMPRQPWMCRAKSSRTGELCTKAAIKGATVCATHGGSTRHVKAGAKARLEEKIPTMLDVVETLATTASHEPTRLNAAKDWLDRAGVGENQKGQQGGNAAPLIQIGIGLTLPGQSAPHDGDVIVVEALPATTADAADGDDDAG
jgi:hypothetical protein